MILPTSARLCDIWKRSWTGQNEECRERCTAVDISNWVVFIILCCAIKSKDVKFKIKFRSFFPRFFPFKMRHFVILQKAWEFLLKICNLCNFDAPCPQLLRAYKQLVWEDLQLVPREIVWPLCRCVFHFIFWQAQHPGSATVSANQKIVGTYLRSINSAWRCYFIS